MKLEQSDEWSELVKLFTGIESEELMDQMLHLMLTINEREFVVDRYKIISMLLTSGLPQRKIAEELGVSIAKITVGSNELKRTPSEILDYFLNFAKRLKSHDKSHFRKKP